MPKDYYKTLGVEKNASADEIKKAFRKLAHQHHPDKQGGDETKFKEINEAYQVLSDADKRQKYDQFGADFEQQGGFGGGMGWEDFMRAARGQGGGGFNANFGGGGFDFSDIFGDVFGGGGGRSRQHRGNDVQVDIEITFREAVFGIDKEIRLMKNNACDVCNGTGAESGSKIKTCDTCKGQGQVRQVQRTILGSMQTVVNCATCQGQGKIPEKLCKHCNGRGVKRSESVYTIKIPAGIDNGGAIRVSGRGESSGPDGQSGDLYVVVHVRPEKGFERREYDIYTSARINFAQAALGDQIDIETLDGKKKLVIPEGTQSYQEFRLKGLGVPHLNSTRRGDQFVNVIVDVPRKLSRGAKKLVEELKGEL